MGRMCFTGYDAYRKFLVFPPMLNSLTLDNNKKVTSWGSIEISLENIKPFNFNLVSHLGNDRVSIKFSNSVLKQ